MVELRYNEKPEDDVWGYNLERWEGYREGVDAVFDHLRGRENASGWDELERLFLRETTWHLNEAIHGGRL